MEVHVPANRTSDPRKGEIIVSFKSVGDTPIKAIFGESPLRLTDMQEKLWNFVKHNKLAEEYRGKRRPAKALKR